MAKRKKQPVEEFVELEVLEPVTQSTQESMQENVQDAAEETEKPVTEESVEQKDSIESSNREIEIIQYTLPESELEDVSLKSSENNSDTEVLIVNLENLDKDDYLSYLDSLMEENVSPEDQVDIIKNLSVYVEETTSMVEDNITTIYETENEVKYARKFIQEMNSDLFNFFKETFWKIFTGKIDEIEYQTENTPSGEYDKMSILLLNTLLVVINLPEKQINLILNMLTSDKYEHIYTPIIHGVVSDVIRTKPLHINPEDSEWAKIEEPMQKVISIYQKFDDRTARRQTFNNRLIRQDMAMFMVMMCHPESQKNIEKIIGDDRESDDVRIAAINEMRDNLDFFDYTEVLKKMLYSDQSNFKNAVSGLFMDYMNVRSQEIHDIINMGGDLAVNLFFDVEKVIETLQQQVVYEHYRATYAG